MGGGGAPAVGCALVSPLLATIVIAADAMVLLCTTFRLNRVAAALGNVVSRYSARPLSRSPMSSATLPQGTPCDPYAFAPHGLPHCSGSGGSASDRPQRRSARSHDPSRAGGTRRFSRQFLRRGRDGDRPIRRPRPRLSRSRCPCASVAGRIRRNGGRALLATTAVLRTTFTRVLGLLAKLVGRNELPVQSLGVTGIWRSRPEPVMLLDTSAAAGPASSPALCPDGIGRGALPRRRHGHLRGLDRRDPASRRGRRGLYLDCRSAIAASKGGLPTGWRLPDSAAVCGTAKGSCPAVASGCCTACPSWRGADSGFCRGATTSHSTLCLGVCGAARRAFAHPPPCCRLARFA